MAGYIHYLGAGFLAVNFILCGLAVLGSFWALKKESQAAKKIFLLGGRRAIFSAISPTTNTGLMNRHVIRQMKR